MCRLWKKIREHLLSGYKSTLTLCLKPVCVLQPYWQSRLPVYCRWRAGREPAKVKGQVAIPKAIVMILNDLYFDYYVQYPESQTL